MDYEFPKIGFMDSLMATTAVAGTEGFAELAKNSPASFDPKLEKQKMLKSAGLTCPDSDDSGLPTTTSIYKVGDEYHVNLDVGAITCYDSIFLQLVVWLSTLTEEDTIIFRFDSGCYGTLSPAYCLDFYLPILNAIFTCRANTVAYVDKPFSGITSYAALTCKEVVQTPMAYVRFEPIYKPSTNGPSHQELTCKDFVHDLYARGQETGILSSEEAEKLLSGEGVFVTEYGFDI